MSFSFSGFVCEMEPNPPWVMSSWRNRTQEGDSPDLDSPESPTREPILFLQQEVQDFPCQFVGCPVVTQTVQALIAHMKGPPRSRGPRTKRHLQRRLLDEEQNEDDAYRLSKRMRKRMNSSNLSRMRSDWLQQDARELVPQTPSPPPETQVPVEAPALHAAASSLQNVAEAIGTSGRTSAGPLDATPPQPRTSNFFITSALRTLTPALFTLRMTSSSRWGSLRASAAGTFLGRLPRSAPGKICETWQSDMGSGFRENPPARRMSAKIASSSSSCSRGFFSSVPLNKEKRSHFAKLYTNECRPFLKESSSYCGSKLLFSNGKILDSEDPAVASELQRMMGPPAVAIAQHPAVSQGLRPCSAQAQKRELRHHPA
eukprot:m.172053 g.172053  ORF g.172053 m.172053 type:complete len:372 (-) comp53268_c0_seq15:4240-5355(-)